MNKILNKVFVLAIAIHPGGVEECHAQVHRPADGLYRILAVGVWWITLREAHAAQAYSGNRQPVFS